MAVPAPDWLQLVRREYLSRFVPGGGSAVKFIVAEDDLLSDTARSLQSMSREHLIRFVPIDAARTRLHMIQDVFFALARAIDWDELAQRWVEATFEAEGYDWPVPGEAVPLRELADANDLDERLLTRQVQRWVTEKIVRDTGMAQDFRYAMTHLCMRRMEPGHGGAGAPVLEWLRGELRAIGLVRQVPISSKITRHNGRAMLRSLCRWLTLCSEPGILAALDVRQLGRTGAAALDGIRYSAAAVLDAFEVLRQLIDDVESLHGLLVVVLADQSFVQQDDPKRSVAAYLALKERIWADVHARGHENPLAPLLQLSRGEADRAVAERAGRDIPHSEARVAVEALRAGVPNRAAVRLLGTSDARFCERFVESLRETRADLADGRSVQGEILAGGFGTGKSHLLGYLTEIALQENFVVSPVAVSKETPLFDPDRMFAAAIRNAIVPGMNDDVMTAALARLQPNAAGDLEQWASRAQLPIFAALMFLRPKQWIGPDELASISRFLGGGKVSLPKVRQWLKQAGAHKLFDLKPQKPTDVALQRLTFTPRLFAAAGFSGWCVLLDETELMGRYSILQRGRSYAEMCRWLNLSPEVGVPGLLGVSAISDTFKDTMFDIRLDQEKIPRSLRNKGLVRAAALAEIGMEAIEQRQHFLVAPNDDLLFHSLGKVHALYRDAYGCDLAIGDVGQRTGSKSMRHFIKSWVTNWDIQRLYQAVDIITAESIAPDYSENTDLEETALVDALEEETS